MARIVLTSDYTLMTDYRDIPLAVFFSCIPTDYLHSRLVFRLLAPDPEHVNGVAKLQPYGLRKVEAALLRQYKREEIVCTHPSYVDRFIGPETEIVGVYTMDPLGLGPVSMSFTNGGTLTAFTKAKFYELMRRIPNGGQRNFKVVVGGPGAWHFDCRPQVLDELHIDHVVHGEVDHCAADIVQEIAAGSAPRRVEPERPPKLEEIPAIQAPSMHGMIEVMRGCGRGCQFCEVTLRRPRYMDNDFVQRELAVNARAGFSNVWIHSDDFFLYKVENWRTMQPNRDAIVDLVKACMAVPGVVSGNPTHGTVSAAVADPELIEKISLPLRGPRGKTIGIQCGLETGSRELAKKIMPRKALPYRAEDWPDLIIEGTKVLNKNSWFPAYTLILGLPGETPDDAWDTIELINRLEAIPNGHFILAPLSFVPIGVLRGEEFYDTDKMLDEARFNVIYRSWRHILFEIDHNLGRLSRLPAPMKALIVGTGQLGGRYILNMLEKYGRQRGFRLHHEATTTLGRAAIAG